MSRAKRYSTREFVKILNRNGYEFVSQRGDHKKYRKGSATVVITKDINAMVALRLIKDNKLRV